MVSPTQWTWGLSKLRELVMDREAWRAAVHGVAKSRTRLSDWTEALGLTMKSFMSRGKHHHWPNKASLFWCLCQVIQADQRDWFFLMNGQLPQTQILLLDEEAFRYKSKRTSDTSHTKWDGDFQSNVKTEQFIKIKYLGRVSRVLYFSSVLESCELLNLELPSRF